ncbi:MAG: acyl transferase [Crocinitomicaceae bacterium]|nr:acyl transferase [Crocinitomicaceae bacterium]
MQRNISLEQTIFDLAKNSYSFEKVALRVFYWQYQHNKVYQQFCDLMRQNQPNCISEIPFLPIAFFKNKEIIHDGLAAKVIFKSSATTGVKRSHHHVAFPSLYEESFLWTYKQKIGEPEDQIIFALLPNYLDQGDSSLVYMVNHLINNTKHPLSGFFLDDFDILVEKFALAQKERRKIILFGVSYALLDLCEKSIDLSNVTIIETGGMKGRRKEMIKEELHEVLMNQLNPRQISSEYGMTELLSQAYMHKDYYFDGPPWMRVIIRDTNDPKTFLPENRTGGVNVIDLANLYSCAFIATDDLGQCTLNNRFKILGRFDNSDIRGCNLLVQ